MKSENTTKAKDREMTDIELAMKIAQHIEKPCEVEVRGEKKNIRDFYMREAEKILPTLKEEYARDFLESIMRKYQKSYNI